MSTISTQIPAVPVASPPSSLRLTGTLVAQAFRFRCERQLRYDLVPETERGPEIPRGNVDPARGPLVGSRAGMELLARAGRAFERRRLAELVRRFGSDAVRGAGVTAHGDAARLPHAEVVAALRDPGTTRFLVQPELLLTEPDAFAARFGIAPGTVRLPASQPDLVRIGRGRDGRVRLGVIDIKWSRDGGIPHYVQVAYYTLLLEEVVRAAGIDAVVETRWGWLWTRGSRGPRRFALAAYRHHVEEWLATDLPRIANTAPGAVEWHLAPRCGGCRYFDHCRAEADRTDDLARVAGITPLAKQVLASKRVRTVKELGGAGFRRGTYGGCHALEAHESALKKRVDALRFGKVLDVESVTRRMGAGEGIRVLLSAEGDPVSGTCFAVGVRVERGGRRMGEADVFLSAAGTRAAEREMALHFLRRLADVVGEAQAQAAERAAGRAGRGRTAPEPPAAHFYVWEGTELALLREMLERHVGDAEVQALVARLAPALFPAAGARGGAAPGTALRDAVAELFALPIPYAWDLASVSATLTPAEGAFAFLPRADYTWPFSSQVAFERAHDAWSGRTRRVGDATEDAAQVRAEIESTVRGKLAALDSVVRAVRERAVRRGVSRLAMDAAFGADGAGEEPIAHAALETLRLFTRMESAAESASLHALHALPARDRARRFEAIRGMEFVHRRPDGALVFEFDPDCREVKFRPGDFALVLTNEDTDGLRETDLLPWKRRRLMMELVEFDLSLSPPRVVLSPASGFNKAVESGDVYLDRMCVLDRAPTDFNTARVVATLRALADGRGEAAHVLDLLGGEASDAWLAPMDAAGGVDLLDAASAAYGRPVLNREQRRAWGVAFAQPVSVVWGPPGTGKTYLLAWMLLGIAAAARREGRPCRILVTAATHRAITNVLVRIDRELAATGVASPLRAVKLRGSGSQADEDLEGTSVEVVPDTRLPGLLAASDGGEPVLVGSTVWSLWKQMRAIAGGAAKADGDGPGEIPVHPLFDVVVVDEASQIKVADSLIALSSLRRGGRVILCGDDRQLAPVVHGSYDRESGTLFRSAFEHFAAGFGKRTLRESRRMNGALVEYPRETFYPGLVSRVPEHRLLCEEPTDGWGDETDALLWELCFAPDDAVVFLTYDGYRATARNPFEASVVARLARLARRGLVDGTTGARYETARFVSDAFAVLSPHRAQNSAILAELLSSGWLAAELPVVDTVERMQGNEREMIVVSYAVADGEYAEREAEFLLNPNRFNVAITRPKAKLVLLMSEAVLRALPADERIMTESMAIKGYARHCADALREVALPGPDGEAVRVRVRCRRL